MAFNFNPEDGLLNTEEFPDKPANGTVARNQFMKLFNQIREYINNMETRGIKANGGNADTIAGKEIGQLGDSHNHNKYLEKGAWSTNGGQDLLVHDKRALVGTPDGHLYLGYQNDFEHIHCGEHTIWHSGNFKKEEYAKTSVGGLGTDSWYWKDETTGLIKQGGSVTLTFNENENVIKTFNFKIPFPNGVQTIIASEKTNNITYKGMFNIACWENDKASATIQAVVLNLYPRKGTVVVYWEATGY